MRRKAPSAVSCCFPFTVVELVGLAGTGTSARHRGHVAHRALRRRCRRRTTSAAGREHEAGQPRNGGGVEVPRRLLAYWVDAPRGALNFVIELFVSGTLRQYREKHRRVSVAAVRRWCAQILDGLAYLHAHSPPTIHRDLKCDNIFVNGNQREVKIGDLGLAAFRLSAAGGGGDHTRCVGTPEFMAPEVYEESYDELADVYSFGMCVLEMVTLDYPYSECSNPIQIYKRVISGIKPAALYRVSDPVMRQFIERCLAPTARAARRPVPAAARRRWLLLRRRRWPWQCWRCLLQFDVQLPAPACLHRRSPCEGIDKVWVGTDETAARGGRTWRRAGGRRCRGPPFLPRHRRHRHVVGRRISSLVSPGDLLSTRRAATIPERIKVRER
ncbi:hypothetical protein OsJ_13740 [Oryza sativa Japonica Group]|uniref:non-specific serine/threonine protein kinase n=1 Tax=Oryza sativa subsp. japonica TaxID=39947 RepID=B9FDK9_ORYSJ|nr:hypothetical protein OsJ_13740 [Oryza sativa Japonica Group]